MCCYQISEGLCQISEGFCQVSGTVERAVQKSDSIAQILNRTGKRLLIPWKTESSDSRPVCSLCGRRGREQKRQKAVRHGYLACGIISRSREKEEA